MSSRLPSEPKNCEYHNNKAIYFCLDPKCQANNRAMCAFCLAETPHPYHPKEQIEKFQQNLLEIINSKTYTPAQKLRDIVNKNLEELKEKFIQLVDQVRSDCLKLIADLEFKHCQVTLQKVKEIGQQSIHTMSKPEQDYALHIFNMGSYHHMEQIEWASYHEIQFNQQLDQIEKKYERFLQMMQVLPNAFIAQGEQEFNVKHFKGDSAILEGHQQYVEQVIQLDQEYVATCSYDHTVKIWKAKTAIAIRTLSHHTQEVTCIVKLDEDETMASCSTDNTFNIWNWKKGQRMFTANKVFQIGVPYSLLRWSKNRLIISGNDEEPVIQVWNWNFQERLGVFEGHSKSICCMEQIDYGNIMATGSKDTRIMIWGIDQEGKKAKLISQLTGHQGAVWAILRIDKEVIASSSSDKTIKLWVWPTKQLVRVFAQHTDEVFALMRLSSTIIASGGKDQMICFWDISGDAQNRPIHVLNAQQSVASLTKFDERRFLSSGKQVRLWY